jgi:hypothetical protein
MTLRAAALSIRSPLAWLGPGRRVEHVTVVIDGDTIVYAGESRGAPPSEVTVLLDGVLLPATADRHVHIGLADPGAVLLGGVTAVRDLAWPASDIFPLADASEAPNFNGPLVRAAGPMLTAPAGYPTRASWAPPGTGLEVRGIAEAAAAVTKLADLGAAHIKVSLNAEAGPTPSDEELIAIVGAAHERSLPVTAHVQGKGQAERALGAGIDEIAHCPWTEKVPDRVIEAMAKSMRMVSTLDIHSYGDDSPGVRVAIDNLVGINLLREGLDLPEVSLVAILDADKEGFLRSETSLIQTIGRAARYVSGMVIMYADEVTDSMKRAISETQRRRGIQEEYNRERGIDPQSIRKEVTDILLSMQTEGVGGRGRGGRQTTPDRQRRKRDHPEMPTEELQRLIQTLEEEMHQAARDLRFEYAARIRDEVKDLQRELDSMRKAGVPRPHHRNSVAA